VLWKSCILLGIPSKCGDHSLDATIPTLREALFLGSFGPIVGVLTVLSPIVLRSPAPLSFAKRPARLSLPKRESILRKPNTSRICALVESLFHPANVRYGTEDGGVEGSDKRKDLGFTMPRKRS
jgi:hypothetical protein